MREKKSTFLTMAVLVGLCMTYSCLDPYTPPEVESNVNYLVVEGFLDIGIATTTIKLSRTTLLSADNAVAAESNASVFIEGEDGNTYALPESSTPGTYVKQNLIIDPTITYRLNITTRNQKKYASDFVPFKKAPPIDSITWAVEGNDVRIYANAHDDQDKTVYYLWKFNETWAYHSKYHSVIKFEDGQVKPRSSAEDIFNCWTTRPSPRILITSTAQLAQDVVREYLLQTIPLTSIKLQSEYSILVRQFALTKDALDYWQQVRKNTENIGSIFGPQPSQLPSNIHCLTNPEEPVIGYFGASSVEEQRIYIFHDQVPPTPEITGYETCEADTLKLEFVRDFGGSSSLIDPAYIGIALVGYRESTDFCVDCRQAGGTTVKPDFWK
jgi:hypothetical protein